MKLVLDELWPFEIAVQLRRRGFDVIAATEPEHAARYRGIEDTLMFSRAQDDGRAVVTDNIDDYEPIRLAYEAGGRPHYGAIYAFDPPFNRHKSDFVIGQMVLALEHFLTSLPPDHEPFNRAHWLRPAPE